MNPTTLKVMIMKEHHTEIKILDLQKLKLKEIQAIEMETIKVSTIIDFLTEHHFTIDFTINDNIGISTFGRKLNINDTFNPLIENRIEITLPILIDPNTARLLRYKKSKK